MCQIKERGAWMRLASTLPSRDKKALDSGELGSTLVEVAITFSILSMLVFGIIFMAMALYARNFVAEAAREASRYASIRGSNSCTILSTFPNCNLNPTTSGNPLQTYIRGLGYPYAQSMNVDATWWSPSASPGRTWTTACLTAACNAPGNMVKVTVYYDFPISIPFWTSTSISLASTSQMVISE